MIDQNLFMSSVMNRLPKVESSVQLQVALRDLYDTQYGIYNHLNPPLYRPLASVAMHKAERVHPDTRLKNALRNYSLHNIGELFRISFLEFMNLTPDVIQTMLDAASEINQEKAKLMKGFDPDKPDK